jgi:hypothetical protein
MIQTHRYFLNNDEDQEGWNLVILDQDGRECTLFASGDYGSYATRFYFEKDFRGALLDFDKEYLLRKIAKRNIYDGDQTKKEIKLYILRSLYSSGLSREEARREWDLIEGYDIYHEVDFHHWLNATELDWDIVTDFMSYRYTAGAVAFAERTLPRLQQLISKELGKEVQSHAK